MTKTVPLIIILTSILSVIPCNAQSGVTKDDMYLGKTKGNISLDALWESKYVYHGRDVLKGEGLYSLDTIFSFNDLFVSFWYAKSDNSEFNELDTSVAYEFNISNYEGYIGYTRYEYISDNENGNDIKFGLTYVELPWITPALDYKYSFETEGSFLELSFQSEIELIPDRFNLSINVIQALDFGYETEGHDGLNNLLFDVQGIFPINSKFDLYGFLAYSIAQEDIKHEGLGNLSWGGIGLSYRY